MNQHSGVESLAFYCVFFLVSGALIVLCAMLSNCEQKLKRALSEATLDRRNAESFRSLCAGIYRNCDVSVTVNGNIYVFRFQARDIVKFTCKVPVTTVRTTDGN